MEIPLRTSLLFMGMILLGQCKIVPQGVKALPIYFSILSSFIKQNIPRLHLDTVTHDPVILVTFSISESF